MFSRLLLTINLFARFGRIALEDQRKEWEE